MLNGERCIALQIAGIRFNHCYRRSRYQQVISVLQSSNPSLSFPHLFKDQHQLKGFYRLINNKKITHSTFISGYQSGLIEYSKEQSSQEPWLLIQDTMVTDFNSRNLDLGYTQTMQSNGFLLHHGLLLDNTGIPLGLLHQQVIHRERNEFGKAKLWKQKEISEKESNKWLEGVRTGVSFSKATGRDIIHIMDREADIVEVVNQCQQNKQYFIIRARHDRSTLSNKQRGKEEALEKFRMFHAMRSAKSNALIKRNLRDAKGNLYAAECHIHYQRFQFRGIEQEVSCVWVKEKRAAKEGQAAEWFLLSNLPIYTVKDAERIAETYSKRWIVEDYHKCYKTGCNIEKRQFDSRKTITTSIGLLALTAVQLLRSRYLAKQHEEAPFEKILPEEDEQKLAVKLALKFLKPIDRQLCKPETTLWWLLLLGRMGGHQGMKQKGLPGWQTIWKGHAHFQSLLEGYRHAINSP
jgi:hypothetical protein